MNNADYWAHRFKQMENALADQSYQYVKNLEKQFDAAIREIEAQMRVWYQRFAENNCITYAEAQKLLKSEELAEFKWTVQEYIKKGKENAISGQWMKELENASARVHVSRLDSLKYQLQQQVEALTQAKIKATTDAAGLAYTESYYHTAFEVQRGFGVGWSMQGISESALKKVLARPWATDGQDFTARCWKDKARLVQTVNQELTRMIATGAAPDKAIAAIAKQFKTSKNNAGRVVMTESAVFAGMAQKDCFDELGVEKFKVIETLDVSTCEVCGEMDGKIFPMREHAIGATAPPFHPWCRGCTAPYFADMEGLGARYARNVKTNKGYTTIPRHMTYGQWKEMQEAFWGEGSIDKMRIISYNTSADKKQFKLYTNVLKELAPKTLAEFEDIKYNRPNEWRSLKYQYRTVNQYKIDSGTLSPQEILDFDEKVITEKRDNFTSQYKKSGNIAGAYLDGDFQNLYLAHSSINNERNAKKYKGSAEIVLLKDNRRFQYIDVLKSDGTIRTDTYFDTEAKLFEAFADLYEQKPFTSITMLSERGMCDSCKGVMEQFQKEYPKVTLNVISNKKVDSNVWKYRRNKK